MYIASYKVAFFCGCGVKICISLSDGLVRRTGELINTAKKYHKYDIQYEAQSKFYREGGGGGGGH